MKTVFSSERPTIIAGPCSAESREQLYCTAKGLKDCGVGILRAGIWKPRTHPDCFEGQGESALDWLCEIRSGLGMKVCTEVLTPVHVEACLKKGVDMLWIGARTTTNPYTIQEIADSLKGVDIPVMVKNPVGPDLGLWMGAIERFTNAGIKELAAIHRGFTSVNVIKYRNEPLWNIALELKTRCPQLPLLCDPSHMGGKAEFIQELSQKALDLGYNGLMIESHCNPECALSDARQQITPKELKSMLDSLQIRKNDSEESKYRETISELRARIDLLDESLLKILAERMQNSREIGEAKRENNISIVQTDRWDDVMKQMLSLSSELGLDPSFVRKLMTVIHEASVEEQNKIMSK